MNPRIIAVDASAMAIGFEAEHQLVLAVFDLPSTHPHPLKDFQLALQMTPNEARQIADAFKRKADEVEAAQPRQLSH